jgi:para-nitrobenzyl esterase
MKRFTTLVAINLALASMIIGGCGGGSNEQPDPSIVETEYGKVQGVLDEGFRVFKGIPYAAAAVGELRFMPPQPPEAWTTTYPATMFGTSCSQPEASKYGDSFGEDCLNLNVWTPYPVPESPAPVMVWFHYGNFEHGSAFSTWNNGQYIANMTGTIVVAGNYRLSALGFLAHPSLEPNSGNYGFLDQRAILTWVKNNIAAFGGDPNNVTIFGSDAGSLSVSAHLVSPGSAGLFHKAIMQSGSPPHAPMGFLTKAEAEAQGELLAATLGCDTGDVAACLRSKTDNALFMALTVKDIIWGTGDAVWGPIIDGTNLTEQPYDAVKAGNFNKVPVMIGSCSEEGGDSFLGVLGMTEPEYETFVNDTFDADAAAVLAVYPAGDYDSPAHAGAQLIGDAIWTCPSRRTARAVAAASEDTYLYYFTHPPHWSTPFRGAYHLAEIWIVFKSFRESLGAHTPEEAAFSDKVMGYWTRFAATGDPNTSGEVVWPLYTQATDEHIVLNPTIETGSNLKQTKCDFWDSLHD